MLLNFLGISQTKLLLGFLKNLLCILTKYTENFFGALRAPISASDLVLVPDFPRIFASDLVLVSDFPTNFASDLVLVPKIFRRASRTDFRLRPSACPGFTQDFCLRPSAYP